MRDLFSQMNKNKSDAVALAQLSAFSSATPILLKTGYSAAAEMSLAQYKANPIAKINAFNSGKRKLDSVVRSDTNNIELRFIRYAIQDNTPMFLGYTQNKLTDRIFLIHKIANIKVADSDLYARVCTYLILRAKLNSQEKTQISS